MSWLNLPSHCVRLRFPMPADSVTKRTSSSIGHRDPATELTRAEVFEDEVWACGGSDTNDDGSDIGDLVKLCAMICLTVLASVVLLSLARSNSTLCIATNFLPSFS